LPREFPAQILTMDISSYKIVDRATTIWTLTRTVWP